MANKDKIALCGDSYMNHIGKWGHTLRKDFKKINKQNGPKKAEDFISAVPQAIKDMGESERVVISIGGGDIRGNRTAEQIVDDIVKIKGEFEKNGKEAYFCKLNMIDYSAKDKIENEKKVRKVNKLLEQKTKGRLINIPETLSLWNDGCHPDKAGYKTYTKVIEDHLGLN